MKKHREPKRPVATHEDANHNVKYKRHARQGVALVRALFDHDGLATDPARVAEVMAQHPRDADDIAEYVHAHIGNNFMDDVTRAMRHRADRGEDHNLEISAFVDKKDGYDRAKDTGEGKSRLDRNRLSDRNHLPKLGDQPTPVYDNMGGVLGQAMAGQHLEINAGAVNKVLVNGAPAECLFVYKADDASGREDVKLFGWVPIDAFVQDKVLAHVVHKDKRIAKELERAQKADVKWSKTAEVVVPHTLPKEIGDLRTTRTQAASENFARHYGARADGSVNLLIDVPGSGGGRIGAASDRIGPGSPFVRATNIPASHTPLFETQTKAEHKAHTARHSAHFLTFVYGHTENQVGGKQYGWILQDHLQPG